MNASATHVVAAIPEIVLAYGVSDEYSFVFHKSTRLFERRSAKLVSTVVSQFTAAYVALWPTVFQNGPGLGGEGAVAKPAALDLTMLPTFDGRAVCYPSWENLRDYLSWRQVDCMRFLHVSLPVPSLMSLPPHPLGDGIHQVANHFRLCATGHINNLYNTTFWALVQQGQMSPTAADEFLKGSIASEKNEILWARFGINYNNEPEMFRKGSVVFREYALETTLGREHDSDMDDSPTATEKSLSKTQAEKVRKAKQKAKVVTRHIDIIKDEFWLLRPWIQSGKPGRLVSEDSESRS